VAFIFNIGSFHTPPLERLLMAPKRTVGSVGRLSVRGRGGTAYRPTGGERRANEEKRREMKMIGHRLGHETLTLGDKFSPDLHDGGLELADQTGHICAKKTIFGIDILKRVLDTSLAG
jgi:hypothetical protein